STPDTAPTGTSTLSLHDALPIWPLYHTQPCPRTTTLAMTTYLKLALMNASRHGLVVVRPLAFISWKIGVSPSESRIQMAIATRRSEEHTSELQSRFDLVCRLLLE